MFFSLIQTLVCVLLVNGGLYALHLTGSSSSSNGGTSTLTHNSASGQQKQPSSSNPFQATTNRLNEELADMAQMERERLMNIGLAKQTAEELGYHGRPIITGRIKMHPVEEMDPEYSAWLNQQAHNVMFGSVVKQPAPALMQDAAADLDYEAAAAAGAQFEAVRRPSKYDYGRVIQPAERDFESPHTLDLDDFMELESANEDEDMFPDLDGYAYIEDLMAEENKERLQHHHQQQQQAQQRHQNVAQFPGFPQQPHHSNPYEQHGYQMQASLEGVPQTLQELVEKGQKQYQQMQQQQPHAINNPHHSQATQQQQQQQQQQHQFNPKYRNNIRMQQKWQRKRAQQQLQLPRNIFGQKNKQQHYFKTQSTNKLSLANSEATATSKANQQHQQQQRIDNNEPESFLNNDMLHDAASADNQVDTQKSNINKTEQSSSSSSVSAVGEQQKPEQVLHPNHKRSGVGGAGSLSSSAAAVAAITSPHSLANQLMLRSARGQRQYDVPQIECPTAMDGMERFACPTPDVQGRYRCIDDHVLCDGFIDCPEGEDEDRRSCMFYKTTKAHLDVLADALLRWARGR